MSKFSLLSNVGSSLLSAGKGLGTAAQYAMTGTTFKDLGRSMKRPIRKGGIDHKITRRNLTRIGLAGQGLGFLTLPFLINQIQERALGPVDQEAEFRRARALERKEEGLAALKGIDQKRRELEIESYEKRLQDVAPDLYNRIAAGRYLPAGAVVIGGVPRRDLIRELAESMHEGAFTPPPTGEVNISDLLA